MFAYFPSKRDLVWLELTERTAVSPRADATEHSIFTVDFIVERILDLGRYPAEGRADLAVRWSIAQDDEELRAYGAAQMVALAQGITAEATSRAPDADPLLIDHVVHALIAVATRCLHEWSQGAGHGLALHEYSRKGLELIAEPLRPLLI